MHADRHNVRNLGGPGNNHYNGMVRVVKPVRYKTAMYVSGESDRLIVPKKFPNKDNERLLLAEGIEGRILDKGKMVRETHAGHRVSKVCKLI